MENKPTDKGVIVMYESDVLSQHIEVRMENETVWLTQTQMVELFASTKQNISLHINNVLKRRNWKKLQLSRNT